MTEAPARRPRVLMVTPNFPPDLGGVQTFAFELAGHLHEACEAFAVVAPVRRGSGTVDRAVPYRVHRTPDPRDGFALSGVLPVAGIATRGRYDVVVAMHWTAAHCALLSPTGWPRRIVCLMHGKDIALQVARSLPPFGMLYDGARNRVYRKADAFAPNSAFTARLLEGAGVARERMNVIGGGVNPEIFHPRDAAAFRRRYARDDEKVLLSVGRLVPRKGVDRVLEVLPDIVRDVPNVRYIIVGDGPERARLEDLARRSGLAGRVTWLGAVAAETLADAYSAADLFVLPASSLLPDVEGFGLVYVEAAACGTPSIGSLEGGVPDAVSDGETGLLVDPADGHALRKAIVSLLSDDERRRAMGERAREVALERHTWRAVASRLMELIAPHAGA